MFNHNDFYITKESSRFNLILSSTHFCLSCSDSFAEIIDALSLIANRYQNLETLTRELKATSREGKVAKSVLIDRKALYKECKDQYKEEIQDTLNEATKLHIPTKQEKQQIVTVEPVQPILPRSNKLIIKKPKISINL